MKELFWDTFLIQDKDSKINQYKYLFHKKKTIISSSQTIDQIQQVSYRMGYGSIVQTKPNESVDLFISNDSNDSSFGMIHLQSSNGLDFKLEQQIDTFATGTEWKNGSVWKEDLYLPYMDHYLFISGIFKVKLWKSKDKKQWEEIGLIFPKCPDSVIDNIPGHIQKYKAKVFDTQLKCYYRQKFNDYIFFTRANHNKGIRDVMYATSKDLFNWSEFKLINMIPQFSKSHDNYYSFNMYPLPETDLFICYATYFKQSHCIRVLLSRDLVNWTLVHQLFVNNSLDHGKNCRKLTEIVYGQAFFEQEMYIYLHENYWQHGSSNKPTTISVYSQTIDRLFSHGNLTDAQETWLLTKPMLIGQLIVNYRCLDDGWLKIEVLRDKQLVATSQLLTGDEIDKQIIWDQEFDLNTAIQLKIIFYQSEIFSVSGII